MTASAHDGDASVQAMVTFLRTFVADMDPRGQLVKANAHRRVYRVQHADRTLYIKQHLVRGLPAIAKHLLGGNPAAAELHASRYAQANGIPTIRILGKIEQRGWNPHMCSTISLGVEGAEPLTEKFAALGRNAHEAARRGALATLAQAVVRLLAVAHDRMFLQVDLHPANLLIERVGANEYRAMFVDLGSVRCGAAVSERAAAGNLAALDQWFRQRVERTVRARFVRDYAGLRRQWTNRPARKRFLRQIEAASGRHARRLYAQRDRRIGRFSAFFDRRRTSDGATVVSTLRFRGLLEFLDVRMPEGTAATDVAAGPCESYRAANWATGAGWRLFGNPAWRKYRSACVLMNRDVPTVAPLACRWAQRGGAVSECGWRMLRPPDGTTLVEWLDITTGKDRRGLLEAVGRLLGDTLSRGAVIHDPAPVNMEAAGVLSGQVRVYWCGAIASGTSVPAPRHACVWMLGQLKRNCPGDLNVTRAERARVLRACCRRLGRAVIAGGWRNAWRALATLSPPAPDGDGRPPLEKHP